MQTSPILRRFSIELKYLNRSEFVCVETADLPSVLAAELRKFLGEHGSLHGGLVIEVYSLRTPGLRLSKP
jgi:hypothetical protein